MKNNITLLYVEDDTKSRSHYANGFRFLFEKVYEADDVARATTLYQEHRPDILLVDINLPDGDGLAFIQTLRDEKSSSLIIVLSAYSHRDQLFRAIELNLFKYLVKPIKNSELLLVLQAAIKKIYSARCDLSIVHVSDTIIWNKEAYTLEYNRQSITLSSHENRFVELLLSNSQRIFSLEEIEYFVWRDNENPSTQAIKNLINRLRKKLPKSLIKNHYGIGYQIITT